MLDNTDELTRLKTAISETAGHSIEEASTMPPAAYTSQALLELERRELFAKQWICLGRVEEIPNPGGLLHHQGGPRSRSSSYAPTTARFG